MRLLFLLVDGEIFVQLSDDGSLAVTKIRHNEYPQAPKSQKESHVAWLRFFSWHGEEHHFASSIYRTICHLARLSPHGERDPNITNVIEDRSFSKMTAVLRIAKNLALRWRVDEKNLP